MWALTAVYSLTTHKDVGHLHPMGKFLAIKSVVVFSWWQGELLYIKV